VDLKLNESHWCRVNSRGDEKSTALYGFGIASDEPRRWVIVASKGPFGPEQASTAAQIPHGIWHAAGHCLLGGLALAVLAFIFFRLQISFSATVCLYLIFVVLVSLAGNLWSSVIVSLPATGCLDYYFVPPLYSFQIDDSRNQLAVITFLAVSASSVSILNA